MPKVWGARTADERQAERRERILRAAIELYGHHGYRQTSVKAVCAQAGLTERYFYESFVNGEDLLRQCFLAVENDLLTRMRTAAGDDASSVSARARAALLVYLDQIRQDPNTARVFLIEMANVSPAAETLVSESLDRFGSLLMEILGADPGLAGDPPPLLLRGVVGGGLHIGQAWAATGFADSVATVADLNLRLYTVLTGPPQNSSSEAPPARPPRNDRASHSQRP